MTCSKCGNQIENGSSFCSLCGAAAPVRTHADASAAPSSASETVPPPPPPPPGGSPGAAMPPDFDLPPVMPVRTDRSMIKMVLLSFITFGIYGIFFYYRMGSDINRIASRHDGKDTMNYLLAFLISLFTFGIFSFVWFHMTFERIGNELKRRGIDYAFGAETFWIWHVLGSFIIIGPFVCIHKECVALNKLAEHYNTYG